MFDRAPMFATLLFAMSAFGCGDDPSTRYLGDPAFRRTEMLSSLTSRANQYAATRIASYESAATGDWSTLPVWNPRAEAIRASDLDARDGTRVDAPTTSSAHALAIDPQASRGDREALVALGRAAFFAYPTQLLGAAGPALRSRDDAARYGLWSPGRDDVGSLVRVALPDGTATVALTCASCHSRANERGQLEAGLPNTALDLGRLAIDDNPYASSDPAHTAILRAWGPGRLDVSTQAGLEPVAIPDLRPVRWLTHLHRDATVIQQSVVSLAIRIETLIVTAHYNVVRPPREVALGLALYLHSLADDLPRNAPSSDATRRGRSLFAAQCASCHAGEGLTSTPVAIDLVGTDPTLGLSHERGTGFYRVPSLRGVGTRGALLHDGTVPGLAVMFDPARLDDGYTGGLHGVGAIPGHEFGLALDASDRAALLAYLETL